ncbi:hypothetical protein GDO81_019529 [Engystomops pustulosus]|uniref:Uncharacterized protein n=1 Tax=Engystomops pustulosus TaxID=76066 RepID=A0AAV6ZJY6_ENGPU|nr:hypothetical protein GDO81_019529 [Engystomops pustulosus]
MTKMVPRFNILVSSMMKNALNMAIICFLDNWQGLQWKERILAFLATIQAATNSRPYPPLEEKFGNEDHRNPPEVIPFWILHPFWSIYMGLSCI